MSSASTGIKSLALRGPFGRTPRTPHELRWFLARRIGLAAVTISLLAGGVAYRVEAEQAEHVALERAATAAGHVASRAMQLQLPQSGAASQAHLQRLLDRSQFVGLRIIDQAGKVTHESWDAVPHATIAAIRSHLHPWPVHDSRNRITVGGLHLIQVAQPLGGPGAPLGYLEGIYRLDPNTLEHEREQIRRSALTAAISVFAAAVLLYPTLFAMLRRSTGLSRQLLQANLSLIRALGTAVARRDADTDAHNYRVTLYAVAVAEAMSQPAHEIADLMSGAFLHDVGKIGIPDRILRKPARLTAEEFEVMKTHSLLGLEIVAGNPWLEGAAQVIRHHHERFDGTGYPDGLRGTRIPLKARIFAVADVFDALTADRPYKAAMPLPEAMSLIKADSGRHFDPDVVAAFEQVVADWYARLARASEETLHGEVRAVLARYFRVP